MLPACFAATADTVVTVTSPANNSTNASAVLITATTTNWNTSDHLEVWDSNGGQPAIKLGNVFAGSTNTIYVLPNGTHTTTVNAVTSFGFVLSSSSVRYKVAESCTNSSTAYCDFDRLGIADPGTSCNNTPNEALWIGNPCGAQGRGSSEPKSYSAQGIASAETLGDSSNTSLNGKSLLLLETQASSGYSNVIFSASSPIQTTTLDSHWTMDLYVYLPNPEAHQAFELDAQYVWGGYWTKFYTECAFNISAGTGYWGVYGGGNGWTFLNGQNGAPNVPCNRSQFSTPWSGGPTSTGWHHIVWTFLRNAGGYAEYESLTFDGMTYELNHYTPTTETNSGSNQGDFSALVQLDGAEDATTYPTVQAYVNELNITHTP
ncbi:MAG TPA: hypothetical protein VNY51_07510 [Candidatus Dormibacteraeota bacterium]|nr:hypothetical protein [Candidatus Dormibacteraeota bacterium]